MSHPRAGRGPADGDAREARPGVPSLGSDGHLADGPHPAFPLRRPLRIAQVAPPFESVPPPRYGGTERVVDALVTELVARGHEVTTFASGDSHVAGRHVPTVDRALRPAGTMEDPQAHLAATILTVLRHAGEFDLIHDHLDAAGALLGPATAVPVVTTFHGRIDLPWAKDIFRPGERGFVAISRSQASVHPEMTWAGIVHNGLDLAAAPFERRGGDALCFVGRVSPEKGILDAIEVARLTGRPLRIAAKVGPLPHDREYYENVFRPALSRADVEFLGEVPQAERDRLMADSYATLMPGSWPEPFGLVAIESLACGTPVIARRAGALPEIVRDGRDGFLGDDPRHLAFLLERVPQLDRVAIRREVLERFSAARMADGYEAVYARMLAGARPGGDILRETTAVTLVSAAQPSLRVEEPAG